MKVSRRAVLGGTAALPLLRRGARAQASANTLRYGLSAFPPNLIPGVNTGAAEGMVKEQLHRGLLSWNTAGELQGELAESWSLDGQGAWVFKLRDGALFHNGDPVTADDVKWSIEQLADPKGAAYMRAQMQSITAIETPDARTVRLVTKIPQATLPSWFANYNVYVVSPKSTGDNWIGAGPFVMSNFERGTSIEVTAFAKYYKPGLPKLKAIKFTAYPDDNLRLSALRAGDVDIIEFLPWQAMADMEHDARLRVQETQHAAFMDILFNASKPPFSDPRVRQAIACAVKREDIIAAAFFGRGQSLEGVPIVQGTPFYDDALAHGWAYNPGKAKQLLAAAGYPNGFSTRLLSTATYDMHKDTAQVVQRYLQDIGIQTEMLLPDWATRVALGTKGQFDLAIQGTVVANNDPDGLSTVMDTALPPSFNTSYGLQAPRTSALLAKGREEFDQQKRVQIYKDMQAAALEEVPLVGLTWRSQGYGLDKSVTGFTNLPGALSTSSGFTLEGTYFS